MAQMQYLPCYQVPTVTDLILSHTYIDQISMMGAGGGSVGRAAAALLWAVLVAAAGGGSVCEAQLRRGYYDGVCPNVESIVRGVVAKKIQQTRATVGATVRLFFHDCFVEGCDASLMVASTANNTAEKDHPINQSLAGDGFDTVIRARAAVDAVPGCRGKVSCADILAMAARDAIALAGGPSYAVELGRLDGLRSTASSVNGRLPAPFFNLDQLNQMFAANGLSQADMVALSAGHSVGLAHCSAFAGRLRGADATLDAAYAAQLAAWCPARVDPRVAVSMDPVTPVTFDGQFFRNLQAGKGLLASDQVLQTDPRSRPTVDALARSRGAFERAFVDAITKMGRVGVKTMAAQGNVRRDCAVLG